MTLILSTANGAVPVSHPATVFQDSRLTLTRASRIIFQSCVSVSIDCQGFVAESSNPAFASTVGALPVVGREREAAVLSGVLDRALSGHGQVLLVSGEAGIGKTRLAGLLADQSTGRGSLVVWGRCFDWEGAPAYWPWIEILRDLSVLLDDECLAAAIGCHGGQLFSLVPALRDRVSRGVDPIVGSLELARYELFDAVSQFFRSIARRQPVVVILDDIHWADESSLLLLQYVTQHIDSSRIVIGTTLREHDVDRARLLNDVFADVSRLPWTNHLQLHGLAEREVKSLAKLLSGRTPPAELVSSVWQSTDGNPFYVVELLRLIASNDWSDGGSDWHVQHLPVPDTVRLVLRQRLRRVPPDSLALLEVGAVIGRQFSLSLVAAAVDQPSAGVAEHVGASINAGILEATSTPGEFQFSHALIQHAVYDDIRPVRRMELHRRIGEILERTSAPDESRIAFLAHHFREASPLVGDEKAVQYAISAGEHAIAQFAWDVAVDHYSRVVQLLQSRTQVDPRQLCDVLLRLGDAQNRAAAGRPRAPHAQQLGAGGSPGGRDTFRRAAHLARDAGLAESLAWAALGVGGFNPHTLQGGVDGLHLLEDALDQLSADDSRLRVRLLARVGVDETMLARYGVLRLTSYRRERVLNRVDAAVAMARRVADPEALMYALVMLCLQYELRAPRERLDAARETLDLASTAGNLQYIAWARSLKRIALLQNNDWSEAQRVDEASGIEERLRMPYFRWNTAIAEAGDALRQGRFSEAAEWITESNQLQPVSGAGTMQLIALHREVGPLDDILDLVERFRPNIPKSSRSWALRIVCLAELGRKDDATRELASRVHKQQCDEEVSLRPLAWLAEACWMLNDRERSRVLLERFRNVLDDTNVISESTDYIGGVIAHYRALLATTLLDWDLAEHCYSRAQHVHEQWRMLPMVAHTCYAWADMLTRRGAEGDDVQASQLLGRSRSIAEDLGMVRLAAKVRSLSDQITVRRSVATMSGTRLSSREMEVLRLIAAGLSDREIAETLYISPRTVTTHVSHILGKLGVRTRTEAATTGLRLELV